MNGFLPYLTDDLPGTGGQIKTNPEDFIVEEIPLYAPSGQGQHVYLTLEKTGMTTLQAINAIADALKISRREIGYAGLKDAQAVTRQTLSIGGGVTEEAVAALNIPGIRVLSVSRHTNKLKVGHLKGNRFVIRVRGVGQNALPLAEAVLSRLQHCGAPNYFGQQRFGIRQNTHRLGLALMRNQPAEFIAEFLGRPHPAENPLVQRARALFDEGRPAEALAAWPSLLYEERKVLQTLVEKGDAAKALHVLDRRLKRLFVSATQSHLFNRLLAQRLATLGVLEEGDVAYIHRSGACFVVESAAREQPRADAFEISPAGPLFGPKYLPARGEPGRRERALLEASGIALEDFLVPGVRLEGGRRPYRVPIEDVSIRPEEEALVLSFTLPSGSYATAVLREVMKNDGEPPSPAGDG